MGWTELEAVAAGQHFVVGIDQAKPNGVSPRSLRYVAATRGWSRPFDGIIWWPGAETPERWMSSGLLVAGDGALVTGWSALYLHGYVTTPPTRVELVVPYGRPVPAHPNLSVRRSRTLCADDETEIDGLRVTVMERTLGQMAHESTIGVLRGYALDARRDKVLSTQSLRECIDRMGNCKGLAKLRLVADQIDEDASESVFEFAMRRRLRAAGFRPDPGQHTLTTNVRRVRLDIPWVRFKVGLECDSAAYHTSRSDLHRDATRHNTARTSEWTVLRATWSHLDDDDAFAELCADLRTALQRAGGDR